MCEPQAVADHAEDAACSLNVVSFPSRPAPAPTQTTPTHRQSEGPALLLAHGKSCPVSDLFGVGGRSLLARLKAAPPAWLTRRIPSLRDGYCVWLPETSPDEN